MTAPRRLLAYTVTPEDGGKTLAYILRVRMGLTRGLVSRLKFTGGLALDGKPARTNAAVSAGQTVAAALPPDAPCDTAPCDAPLAVAYQDADVLVVDKPAPMASVHGRGKPPDTLENAVFAHMGCPARFVYRPVSRLDKGTSGLVAIALSGFAHAALQRQLHTDQCVRQYIALTDGLPPKDCGVIDLPLGKAPGGVKRSVDAGGKRAVTRYQLLEAQPRRALLLLTLETGRTHQIRAHLAALGCPVTGDYLYGQPHPALDGRFALHSAALTFCHPVSGAVLSFSSPPPIVFSRLLHK